MTMGTLLRKSKVKPITPTSPFPAEKLARRRRRLAKKPMEGEDLLHVELYKEEEPASPFSADKLAWQLLRSLAKKPKKGLDLVLRKLCKGSPPIVRQLFKDEDEGSPPIARQLFKDDQEENQGEAEANNVEDLQLSTNEEENNQGEAEANKVEDLQLSTNEEKNNQGAAEQREHQELQYRINKKLLSQEHVKSPQTIVEDIRAYIKSYRETVSFKGTSVKKNDKILQVVDMNSEHILSKIGKLKAFARSNITFPVPSRADVYQDYNLTLDRNVLLQEDVQKLKKNQRNVLLDNLLTVIYELCMKEKTMEIRTIYYLNPRLYKKSREAKGMPDVASRYFLRKMRNKFKLPVFALVDFDPYGLKIFSVFRNGSKNMSFDSENLTTPDIKLLGMLHTDIEKYGIPEHLKLKMTDFDIKTATSSSKKTYFSEEEKDELLYTCNVGIKCEVEAWNIHGIEYLSKVVLPLKIHDAVRPKC
ncbi:hypothetical protein M0R45_013371 [Rubus argutus]|uniref:Topoisomerase 6 subunit A/Spo11 TOPRIM domain-containing protein n=1 Tax=Rubus argutus TaxID=59490 RepID=A0AAW1XJI0_RUBAR